MNCGTTWRKRKTRRRKNAGCCGWTWSGSCCCDRWLGNCWRLAVTAPSLCPSACSRCLPSHYGTYASLPRAPPPSPLLPVCVDSLAGPHHNPPFLCSISPSPSLHVQAEPPVLVFLAAAASPALCDGRRPASLGCGGATLPRRCRRIRSLARSARPHPRSHRNRSHQAHLPQQNPRVVECWSGQR